MSKVTVLDVLANARKWLGFVEGPRNNETPFGAWTGFQFQPWCASFASKMFFDAGGSESCFGKYASTRAWAAKFQSLGRWRDRNPQVGDVVFFNFGAPYIHHVGIVEKVLADGTIQTLEGNTSAGSSGSQANGGGVYRRLRKTGIAGYGIPDYAPAPTAPGHTPTPNTKPYPDFPLPAGWYFGPMSGPTKSVSGFYSYKNAIAPWQRQMQKRGWRIKVTGVFDAQTQRVVIAFSKEKRIPTRAGVKVLNASVWKAAWTAKVT